MKADRVPAFKSIYEEIFQGETEDGRTNRKGTQKQRDNVEMKLGRDSSCRELTVQGFMSANGGHQNSLGPLLAVQGTLSWPTISASLVAARQEVSCLLQDFLHLGIHTNTRNGRR
mmetsp:Transcript_25004/g.66537  ORF Transcript_25004/g.66537 Transcript_25004/m.66537 type:complete len:115 (+) Transcript_25004:204-548(+)